MKPWLKYLLSIPENERIAIIAVLEALKFGKTEALDLKKLSGHETLYRIRVGERRIVVTKQDGRFEVVTIGPRSSAYRNLG